MGKERLPNQIYSLQCMVINNLQQENIPHFKNIDTGKWERVPAHEIITCKSGKNTVEISWRYYTDMFSKNPKEVFSFHKNEYEENFKILEADKKSEKRYYIKLGSKEGWK